LSASERKSDFSEWARSKERRSILPVFFISAGGGPRRTAAVNQEVELAKDERKTGRLKRDRTPLVLPVLTTAASQVAEP
jgi:hypothetical protein